MKKSDFERAANAMFAITTDEIQALAWLKALELMNGLTFVYLRQIGLDPLRDSLCKENLAIVREVIAKKQGEFFGVTIDVRGKNLETLIDYMASEFRKSGVHYSAEYMFLERNICVMCGSKLIDCIFSLEDTKRFAEIAALGAVAHVFKAIDTLE